MYLSLLAMIFVKILYELHNKISQNLVNKTGFTFVGIRAKKEELVLPPFFF